MNVQAVVDGWELQPEPRRRGIGRFLAGVLPAVVVHGPDVAVLQPSSEVGTVELPAGCRARPVTRWAPRTRVRAGIVEHVARLPVELARTPHDVAWSPGTLPPAWTRGPWVQTLHDLAPLVLDLPGYGFHRAHWRLLGPRVCRADRVVAVSRFAADEGIRVLDLDPARVEVVPHGVDAAFRPDGPVDEGDGRPFVAAVATDDPRKGVDDLVELAARLADGDARLHVAGALGEATRRRLSAAGAVVRGHVPDLPAFLRGAQAVVVTSRYEGFGFVPLEAMACGAPVVAYDTTAVGEVVGDGGCLVPLGDLRGLVGHLTELLVDERARTDQRDAGLARAARFTWDTAGAAYATVLDEVARTP